MNDNDAVQESGEVRLPTTVEEFQRARRDAYATGAYQWAPPHVTTSDVVRATRELYPIRRKVPRVLTDTLGVEWRWTGSVMQANTDEGWHAATGYTFSPERCRIWHDLTSNPFAEVSE